MGKLRDHLTPEQALSRLDSMLPLVIRDIKHAVSLEACMEGANDAVGTIKEAEGGLQFVTVGTFNVLQSAQALNLALALSRLYDPGSRRRFPRDHRDVASLPALMWLLRPAGCADLIAQRASGWINYSGLVTTQADINVLRSEFAVFQRSREGRAALRSLREFRNKVLAHTLMVEIEGAKPVYMDLFILTRFASRAGAKLLLLVEGTNWDHDERRRIDHRYAKNFWLAALPAAARADD